MSLEQINNVYAGFLIAGGLVGYFKAGSIPSLVAGAGSGLLVGACTQYQAPYKTAIITGVSAALAYVMGKKFANTGKFMPAGLIAAASVVTLLSQLNHWYRSGSPN